MQRMLRASLAVALALAPLGAKAADLVVWLDEGYYAEEQEAVREIIAAFEQETGKQVELVFHPEGEHPEAIVAALETGQPPDFAFGLRISADAWALDNELVDLSIPLGTCRTCSMPISSTERCSLTGAPGKGLSTHCRWGARPITFTSGRAFWSRRGSLSRIFPTNGKRSGRSGATSTAGSAPGHGARRHLGRRTTDVVEQYRTSNQLEQFMLAYEADYVTPDGRLVIDDPEVRRRNIKAIDSYAAIYLKGCTPRDSVTWAEPDNNEQFHSIAVVMTANNTLSIVNALKHERPEDYYENTATVEWPLGPGGKAFSIRGSFFTAVVLKDGGHGAAAKQFVHFLVSEGWLMHCLNFSGERILPPIAKLLDQPFWLDPTDQHRMAAVMQATSRPMPYDYVTVSGDWRHALVWEEGVWPKAVHRVVTEGISPEQAVDEAFAASSRS